jgi:hypothetical protein
VHFHEPETRVALPQLILPHPPYGTQFRETQTPAADREDVPLVIDELDGQVHLCAIWLP